MLIKVDEDLPRAIARILCERHHQAVSVMEQQMGGASDSVLWELVQREGRFLITGDKGFADVRLYTPATHQGVLLLRPQRSGIRPLTELLERVLASYDLEDFVGTITVASPRGIRIRRPK